ncbi:MAG: glycosyltransferase [Gemmatimonadota bacterium]|nr:glycosyltransferase [Gemmatimonadota bacterium]
MAEKQLRVAHILGTLSHGGLQGVVLNLIRELAEISHIVVFQSEEKGALHSEYASVSDIRQCPHDRGPPLSFLHRLRKIFRETAPDVVLAHLFGNHTLVSWAAFLAGVPATYGVSTNDPVHYSGSRWKPMMLAHAARPFCRGEIAVSESVGRVLTSQLHLPARRVTVIPNGCPVEEIATRAAAGAAARKAALPADRTARALMAAGISRRTKDHPTALRAVALLRQQKREVELWLAGGASSESARNSAESLTGQLGIRDLVRFLGVREDVPELMGASDIVVHATHSEGLSIAVLEAMAAGVPVVATDIPSCREALDGGGCGLLVPPRDAAALAEAISRILDDEPLRLRLVQAASERVRSHYHIKRMAADFAALLLASSSAARVSRIS